LLPVKGWLMAREEGPLLSQGRPRSVNRHNNARLIYQGRRILGFRIIHEDLLVREAAKTQEVSPRTAYKRLWRYRKEGGGS